MRRPLGTREFIGSLEREMDRNLAAQRRGKTTLLTSQAPNESPAFNKEARL
jgi:hypothetical protein